MIKDTDIRAEYTKNIDPKLTEKEAFKQVKNTVSYVFEHASGAYRNHSEMGILTGVRPTKLLHKSWRAACQRKRHMPS